MLDWTRLEVRQISKMYRQEGYTCPACEKWNGLFYLTIALEQNIQRLDHMRPDHPSFRHHFIKTVKRAEVIQERGRQAIA